MSKKRRRKRRKRPSRPSTPKAEVRSPASPRREPDAQSPARRGWAAVIGVSCVVAALLIWWWYLSARSRNSSQQGTIASANRGGEKSSGDAGRNSARGGGDTRGGQGAGLSESGSNGTAHSGGSDSLDEGLASADSGDSGSFLESFTSPSGAATASDAARGDEALEESFHKIVADIHEQTELKIRLLAALAAKDTARMMQLRSETQARTARLNSELSHLEGELRTARESRPDDPVVQWLTGELLMHVGGEPVSLLPYFQRAVEGGLERPRLFASLARVQFEANQFAAANDSIRKAFELGEPDRFLWDTYARIALGTERFDDLVKRLDAAFPDSTSRPQWEQSIRERAVQLAELWQSELSAREADRKKNDLPRVRLTIEHRRFAADGQGNSTSQVESTGRGEVELELFEDQAPQTVANFVSLVEQGFYDGTLFMVAESATYVRGGDPNTRNDDPGDDGEGGPGYVIPDEFQRPDARDHFRGALSMVNTGPHTAGSQFFITLAPNEAFNRHFTVFGRVIRGQQVVEGITQGRTTKSLGRFGRLIPGDVLVKAEIIRTRPHAYTATKE